MPSPSRLKHSFLGLLALALMGPTNADAAFSLATDSFTYSGAGGTVPVSLSGQNGGSGWNGAWNAVGGTSPIGVVNPGTPLAVNNTPFGPIDGGDRALRISGNGDNLANRLLSEPYGGEVTVSFLFRFDGTVGQNDFLTLWFANGSDTTTGPNIGLKGNQDTGSPNALDLFVRTSGSAGSGSTIAYQTNLVSGEDYYVVGILKKVGGSTNYNSFGLAVYDDLGNTVGFVNASGNTGLSQIDRVGLRGVNLDNGVAVTIDELRIAAAPAPAGVVLAAVGAGCLFGYRGLRRRKA
jgi:hypothetical protein